MEHVIDNHRPVSVAILAGGKSTRMGIDKALLRLAPDGPTLLEMVVERVAPLTSDVFIVATDRPAYASTGVRVLPDLYPNAASLGGIGSALRHAKHDRCLVVSCDHPFLNPELLLGMMRYPGNWDVLLPVIPGSSKQGGDVVRQTLHAIYGKRCIDPIERTIATGKLQIIAFFEAVRVQHVGIDWVSSFDPDLRSFFSVNTPEAADRARGMGLAGV